MILIKFSKTSEMVSIFGASPWRYGPPGSNPNPRVILLRPINQRFRYIFYPEHFYTDAETICLHSMYSYVRAYS